MLPYLHIFGQSIPMYGLCMAIGILLSAWFACLRLRKEHTDVNALLIICACALGFGLFGAKLLYLVICVGLSRSIEAFINGDFRALLEGGQVFYGGLIFGLLGAFFGAKLANVDIQPYCTAITPCIPLAHSFGRIGCFFAGCCYGFAYDGILCTSFPAAGIYQNVFPVQLMEACCNFILFAALTKYTRKPRPKYRVMYVYLISYAFIRFLLEFARGDLVRGSAGGLSTSQWISIVLFFLSGILLLLQRPLSTMAASHAGPPRS